MRTPILVTAALILFSPSAHAQPPERVNLGELGRLAAFSHATRLDDLIFTSGTLGTREGLGLVEGGVAAETAQTLANIERILEASGSDLAHVAKCTVYLTDMSRFSEMNEAYIAVFGDSPPARTTIGAKELALGAMVEIECIAKRKETPMVADLMLTAGTLESDGETIYYEVTGDGPVLVLSHGYGGSHAIWYQQVPVLARHFRVVTWDARGFGRSSNRGDDAGPESSARDLARLFDHLGIDRAHLVGQSMGGWTVTRFALDHPQKVASLVLADTLGGLITPEARQALQTLAAQPRGEQPIHRHPALGDTLGNVDPTRAFLYKQIGSVAEPPPQSAAQALFSADYYPRRSELEMPILLIVGSEDSLFPPPVVRSIANALPGSRVAEIPGAGHSPYFETPEAWNRVLVEFLLGLENQPSH